MHLTLTRQFGQKLKPLKRYQYERYAVLCNLAYARNFKPLRYGFTFEQQFIVYNQFAQPMIRILWSDKQQEAIVVIKGSHNVLDWLLNLLVWPKSCDKFKLPYHIHFGFYCLLTQPSKAAHVSPIGTVFQCLEQQVTDLIDAGKKITITGHSSGGAIGCVFADYMERKWPNSIKRVVTFGQPAIGNWQFRQAYTLADRTYRICCDLDIVTFMPPIPMLYWHVGTMLWLYNGRIYQNTPTLFRLGRSLLSWVARPFSYHLMSKYIRNKDFFDKR